MHFEISIGLDIKVYIKRNTFAMFWGNLMTRDLIYHGNDDDDMVTEVMVAIWQGRR